MIKASMFEPVLDCPCCGANATLVHIVPWKETRGAKDKVGVRCTSCPLNILFKDKMDANLDSRAEFAIKSWNTRA